MRISDWSSDVCSSELLRRDPLRLCGVREIPCVGSLGRGDGSAVDRREHRVLGRKLLGDVVAPKAINIDDAARRVVLDGGAKLDRRSEEHTSELQSLMRISYAVFCLKKKNKKNIKSHDTKVTQQD